MLLSGLICVLFVTPKQLLAYQVISKQDVLDGNWSDWSDWSVCSSTCEGGTKTKWRTCTNPRPQYGGTNCPSDGQTTKTKACNEDIRCRNLVPEKSKWVLTNSSEWILPQRPDENYFGLKNVLDGAYFNYDFWALGNWRPLKLVQFTDEWLQIDFGAPVDVYRVAVLIGNWFYAYQPAYGATLDVRVGDWQATPEVGLVFTDSNSNPLCSSAEIAQAKNIALTCDNGLMTGQYLQLQEQGVYFQGIAEIYIQDQPEVESNSELEAMLCFLYGYALDLSSVESSAVSSITDLLNPLACHERCEELSSVCDTFQFDLRQLACTLISGIEMDALATGPSRTAVIGPRDCGNLDIQE